MSDWANEKEEMEHTEYIHLQDTEELEAEISRLKGELLASNKGAKTNAEVNKLAVKEIDRLKGEIEKRDEFTAKYLEDRNLWKSKAEALAVALKKAVNSAQLVLISGNLDTAHDEAKNLRREANDALAQYAKEEGK